ncbi:hypothetical protein QTG54_011290 [Skeletonema marinoi]|uniref:Uncharacterized protein n=1 Tax=Skeletonema marinoi TaxID=267567 RepID=A0AAD9D8B9_9STRA|nr:hypothetical protein QTG54_011290 [Skeletonema marinoi]
MRATLKYPGWALFVYLLIGQGLPAMNYDLGVRMGFALGDLIFYIPLLGFGLLTSNYVALSAALGITTYWPIVCLAAAINAQDVPGWSLDDTPFLIVLPMISMWGLWCLLLISHDLRKGKKKHYID